MSRVVWKYELGAVPSEVFVNAPMGAQFLSFGVARGRSGEWVPSIWALVDPAQPVAPFRFWLAFTGEREPGQPGDPPPLYRGTAVVPSGLVYHLWELPGK